MSLTAENPVGVVLGTVTPVNPFGQPNGPGPVTVPEAADARRDPSALATFATEEAAASRLLDETANATVGVVRRFLPPERVSFPYPYERLTAELDDSDSADLIVNPTPSGDEGSNRGGHGALDVTQSRATLIVSGRGARRTPLDPAVERASAIKHVDLAPTVAAVLGVSANAVGQYLNNGNATANPAAEPAILRRQDGKVVNELLEPKVNNFVVVIDGMIPENVTATQTPNICNLIGCPGAVAPDASARATVYTQARATMISQTNANHTAMLTGAYGQVSGVVANNFYNRATGMSEPLERPSLIRVDTLFDMLRREAPHLRSAAVLGKEKLRELYQCTADGSGACTANSTDNPEGVAVTHVRPDFLRGAATSPAPGTDDCPAEPASGSGVAQDGCIMDAVLRLSATEDPDFTFVNLGNVDGLQHVDGPNSPAGVAAVTGADQQIGRLVTYLKESGKWQDTVLIITADHSFSWTGPDPTHRINLASLYAVCPGEPFVVVPSGGAAQVYLTSIGVGTTALSESQRSVLKCMRDTALAQSGVSEAFYRLENPLDPGKTLAANHPGWGLDDQRAGDLVVTALASGPAAGPNNPTASGTNPFEVSSGPGYVLGSPAGSAGALQGEHGHPGTRHIPFIVVGGGSHILEQTIAPTGTMNEGDDTAANPGQAENIDIAPTVAWIYGLDPVAALPAASGRALTEAFIGVPIEVIPPHANRAIIFIFDANNSVRVHDLMADCGRGPTCGSALNKAVPAIRSLLFHDTDGRLDAPQGTLTSFGSMAAFPTVTFPNHNVVGSGVYPGHHGIVGNRYYERDIETERSPIDPTDPRNPIFFFSSALLRRDFETLHEAVHRAFGDWEQAPEDPMCDPQTEPCNGPSGAFTASVNEPSARGADFASLEASSNDDFPAAFAALAANPEFVQDTNQMCSNASPDNYGQESVLDDLSQSQSRALYSEASTSGLPAIPGINVETADTTGGAAHPDPKYMIANYTLTDGSGHEFGPHGICTREAYRDTSSRFGRVLTELANHDRFVTQQEPARLGETFILLTGDHGMENQNPAGKDFGTGVFFGELFASDIEFIWTDRAIYLLTLHAEVVGSPDPAAIPAGQQTVTFRITDDDVNASGGRRPAAGATVQVENGTETLSGTTNMNGEVTFTFTLPLAGQVVLRADKDAAPAMGARTTGSTSPDPMQHGLVTKTNFNDLITAFPVGIVSTTTTTTAISTTSTSAASTTTTTLPPSGALNLIAARLRGQRAPSTGSVRLQGDFVTPPPFTVPPSFTVRVQDSQSLDRTHTFATCRTTASGRIICRDTAADGIFRAIFRPFRRNPGAIRFQVSFQRQAISAPFAAPVTMTLTHNGGVVRSDSIMDCRLVAAGLSCREF